MTSASTLPTGSAASPGPAQPQRQGDIYDPATGQVTGVVDFASSADVDDAVAAATEAAKSWGRVSLAKRATVLFAFRELVKSHTAELAALITERARQGRRRRRGRGRARP